MEDVVRDPPREIEPGAVQTEAAYRGFLFADLRGYTAFVERHGDTAAADLLDAYRALVRDEVARHAGAEVHTEGDSFYVVFPSARRAVACGLAIVAAAVRARDVHPERPIRVGIGINAGETVQRGEGYVGSAVNLAARVCAQAHEGEVLVTGAVRDAVGAGSGLRFPARGTRRLKGIARPVALFAAEPDTAPARRGVVSGLRARRWVPVAVAAAAAMLTLAAIAVLGGLNSQAPSGAATSPSATSSLPASGPIGSPSPSIDPSAYPNAAEAELLAKLDASIADHCKRGDDDDRPRFVIDAGTARTFNFDRREPIRAAAALECEVPSTEAPDVLRLWSALMTGDVDSVHVPESLILNRAGALGVPRGSCSESGVAYDRWELGDLGGWLMCREDFGDAVIDWSYDGSPLLASAMRRDGDLAVLLRWWTEEARLLRP